MLSTTSVMVKAAPMAAGIITPAQQLFQTLSFAVQAVYAGTTISGVIELQASVDYNPNFPALASWDTIPNSPQTLSAAGSGILNFGNAIPGFPYIRAVFTDSGSSGDAVMTITANIKGF